MSEPLQDATGSAAVAALNANTVHYWSYRGRAPAITMREDAQFTWMSSAIPSATYNRILRANLAADEIDTAIDTALGWFRKHGQLQVMRWAVGPETRPADLGSHLQRRGFTRRSLTPGMAVDLRALP